MSRPGSWWWSGPARRPSRWLPWSGPWRPGGTEVESRLALTGNTTSWWTRFLMRSGMSPDYDLGIMRPGQNLYDVAHACLDGLREVIRDFRPDLVLVQGDTASVFFGSSGGLLREGGRRTRRGGTPERAPRIAVPGSVPGGDVPKAHRGPDHSTTSPRLPGPGQPPERRGFPRPGSTSPETPWWMLSWKPPECPMSP